MTASIESIETEYMDFRDVSTQYLITTVQLKRVKKNDFLEGWLKMPYTITPAVKQQLVLLMDKLDLYGTYYTRGELSPALNKSAAPDFRPVIYWNPMIQTDKEVRATVHFNCSDGIGDFQVRVMGLTEEGEVGTEATVYKVAFDEE